MKSLILLIAVCCGFIPKGVALAEPPKVIIDTDFNTIYDDGQAAVMAAQLYASGTIDLLGFTIASGNEWRDQEAAECLKAVERLGIEDRVKVYLGAQYPLLHDYFSYLLEKQLFGPASTYVGAYSSPQPDPAHLTAPPDGFARRTRPAREDAIDFIIRMAHRYPHEVTILEIAPPTNVALAIRKDPTIVPLLKQIVTMAGQIYVPGNAFNGSAEFNWWFDPEATKIVLRAKVPHVIIPLDCTNTLPLTKQVFDQIVSGHPETIITRLFAQAFASSIGTNPPPYIYDTTALAYFVHPEFATDSRKLHVDINSNFDKDYGKSNVFSGNTYPYESIGWLQQSTVVFGLNNAAFYAFYVDLLTRPVPVKFRCPPHDVGDD
ncbi:MAG TPA: nucleoside hydrolase [Chthoniobacterales bacterium]